MSVEFTKDTEKERIQKEIDRRFKAAEAHRAAAKSWSLFKSNNIVEALRTARDMGWEEGKVQVRLETDGEISTYHIEPYEEGCGCRGLLKYNDYF